jgi:hypothetical protein
MINWETSCIVSFTAIGRFAEADDSVVRIVFSDAEVVLQVGRCGSQPPEFPAVAIVEIIEDVSTEWWIDL